MNMLARAVLDEREDLTPPEIDAIEADIRSGLTWRERQARAESSRGYTTADRAIVNIWHFCAVGEQHAAMPTVVVYRLGAAGLEPVDAALFRLGMEFSRAVMRNNDPALGARFLEQIEDRVLQLKREAGS